MKKIIIIIICLISSLGFSQFKDKYKEMDRIENPKFENFDKLVFDATSYIFSNPVNLKSEDFFYAVKIAQFWMNRDTEFGMPIFGDLYNKLTNVNNEQFFYTLSMMHYNLIQKIKKNRIIKFVKVEGIKFSELPEVREVQYEGAKIFLGYAEKIENNLPLNKDVQIYIDGNKNEKLQELMFK